MRLHRSAVLLSAAVLLVTGRAAAAPSEGEQLFREGRAAMQAHDLDRACAKFAESQRREPAPGTALNLGECEEQRGHLVAATEAFTIAAATFATAEKQRYAQSRAEAADKRIPRLTVRASAPPAGLSVHAGAAVIILDTETKMDPGDVVLRAEAPERRPKELKVSLREGKDLEIDIGAMERLDDRPRETAGHSPAPTPPADAPSSMRTVGLVLGGVGVGGLIAGGIAGALTLDRAATVEAHCDAALACDPEGLDAARSGETLSLVSTVALIGGGALFAGGAALFVLGGARSRTRATIGPSGASIVMRGSF